MTIAAIEARIAKRRVEAETEDARQRERFLLFALESIATDGFPRVSGYACDVYERDGLIERTGNDHRPYRLTGTGQVRLAGAPVDVEGPPEVLF